VAACLKLAAGHTCDLTRAFKDPLNHYQARVQAFTPTQTSNWTSSGPFRPLSDSEAHTSIFKMLKMYTHLFKQTSPVVLSARSVFHGRHIIRTYKHGICSVLVFLSQRCWALLMCPCLAVGTVCCCSSELLQPAASSRSHCGTGESSSMCAGPGTVCRYVSDLKLHSTLCFYS